MTPYSPVRAPQSRPELMRQNQSWERTRANPKLYMGLGVFKRDFLAFRSRAEIKKRERIDEIHESLIQVSLQI